MALATMFTFTTNVCFLVHAKIFCAKRKYTSLYIMLKLKCQGVQLWPYLLCIMQVNREKPVIARNFNFHLFYLLSTITQTRYK